MRGEKEKDSTILPVTVHPKASENRIAGFHGEAIKVKVTAPATGGKANQRLVEIVADRLNIAKSRIEIIQGHRSRKKLLRIWNVSPQEVRDILGRPLDPLVPPI
jgi:uncharacterized protein (TIGR00251 family)